MSVSKKELERQYRVLKQTLGIHAILRDRYAKLARTAEITLLGCSVLFCATTFAGDSFYQVFNLLSAHGRTLLGFASVMAFFTSLVILILDWKGKAALHEDATRKWTETLSVFRQTLNDDGSWPGDRIDELTRAYWEADRNTISIPDKRFNDCKARYLLKVEESKMISAHPGCPRFILRLIVRAKGTVKAIKTGAAIRS